MKMNISTGIKLSIGVLLLVCSVVLLKQRPMTSTTASLPQYTITSQSEIRISDIMKEVYPRDDSIDLATIQYAFVIRENGCYSCLVEVEEYLDILYSGTSVALDSYGSKHIIILTGDDQRSLERLGKLIDLQGPIYTGQISQDIELQKDEEGIVVPAQLLLLDSDGIVSHSVVLPIGRTTPLQYKISVLQLV